jgi:thymidine kinase
VTDPQFRAALAAHGYTLDGTGEILELAQYVGPFSARPAQIGRNVDHFEREWMAAHPSETAGPALQRSWDARAWAEGRPDKVTPRPGADLDGRWRTELAALGYRDRDRPVALTPAPVGALDRDGAVERVLGRLAAARSAWNAADVRGEVEQLIAAHGIVADGGVRAELAEDLTARTVESCVRLRDSDGVPVVAPEHVRALTSQPVLDVEADLTGRLAARSAVPARNVSEQLRLAEVVTRGMTGLDAGQATAAVALAGDWSLLVVEGAAGAGKTTTLAAARQLVEASGSRQVIVTPTLKAAKVATAEVGGRAGSAAWLVYQHGWRWSSEGSWTRLAVGQADPVTGRNYTGPSESALLWPGDVLVVDEAGMLDQDTAFALLTVADECQVRVALLGDRHQLAAVGRGGVLDLAADAVDPAAHLILDGVHRFTRTEPTGRTAPDTEYADLTLAMRTGDDPGAVFDALVARGQIRIHPDAPALKEKLAGIAAAPNGSERAAVVADTLEQVAELNAAIRDRLVAAGRVDDGWVVTTRAGQRIGAGDRVATRRNDQGLGVANRDLWVVTAISRRGAVVVTPADTVPPGVAPADLAAGVGARVLPPGYVTAHLELAYASTAHGVQGDTVPTAHMVIGESTGAASAYVGMTRGRQSNTAHLVAADAQEAREQWIAVFARDRADLGPAHAAQLAAAEAACYAPPRPPSRTRPLGEVLADLGAAWSAEQDAQFRLVITEPVRDRLQQLVALDWKPEQRMDGLQAREWRAWQDVEHADRQARENEALVRADVDRIRQQLLDAWDGQRDGARRAAAVLLQGPGRFGQRRAAVARAGEQLTDWADAWRPHLPSLPAEARAVAEYADRSDDRPALWRAFDAAAHRSARQAHPEHAALQSAAATARTTYTYAARAREQGRGEQDEMVARFGRVADTPDPAATLAESRPGNHRRSHRPGRRPGPHRPTHERACRPGPAAGAAHPGTRGLASIPRRRPPAPATSGPATTGPEQSPAASLPARPSHRPLRPRSGPGEMTGTRGSCTELVEADWRKLEAARKRWPSPVTKRPRMAPSVSEGPSRPTPPGASHARPHPARTRVAHHRRSRRPRSRPCRHPPVLAAPQHRTAQLPARPPRPLPPRRSQRLDQHQCGPDPWPLTTYLLHRSAGDARATPIRLSSENVPRPQRPPRPSGQCRPGWQPTPCTPRSRTPPPTPHPPEQRSWPGSNARSTPTGSSIGASEPDGPNTPARPTSSGWPWPPPTPVELAAVGDRVPLPSGRLGSGGRTGQWTPVVQSPDN